MKMHTRILTDIEKAALAGLRESGKGVLAEARERAPEDEETLKRSGRVVVDDRDVVVKFTAPHAWLQHEKTEYEHPNGGEAHYLENAAVAFDVVGVVGGHVKAVLGGG